MSSLLTNFAQMNDEIVQNLVQSCSRKCIQFLTGRQFSLPELCAYISDNTKSWK